MHKHYLQVKLDALREIVLFLLADLPPELGVPESVLDSTA